jgi:hypothetical protein
MLVALELVDVSPIETLNPDAHFAQRVLTSRRRALRTPIASVGIEGGLPSNEVAWLR